VRAVLIDPAVRQRRSRRFKRWERAAAMELWQMDIVGGFLLADGTSVKALTGVDDHSRFSRVGPADAAGADPTGLRRAAGGGGGARGAQQILTDNGRVFTGRFNHPPVEVLFDRI